MKRLVDVLASTCALLVLGLPMLLLALAIRLGSPGPALFRQVRVGRGGRPFTMFKFRTMVEGAERLGPWFTDRNDPRITALGAALRRTSLDELPQLFNVWLGHMSLVGPRPDVPAMEARYAPDHWRERQALRPGLTGLAQASLRSEATWDQRLALDLAYVRTHGLWLDLKILGMTVRQVMGKGSY